MKFCLRADGRAATCVLALGLGLGLGTVLWAGEPPALPQVQLAWDPNQEEDLAGYRIHYGLGSRDYFETVEVGNVTHAWIELPPIPGVLLHFAATAYNLAGLESDYSNEVTYRIPVHPEDPAIRQHFIELKMYEDHIGRFALPADAIELEAASLLVRAKPRHGQVLGTYPEFRYRPDPDFHGEDGWAFVLHDGRRRVIEVEVRFIVFSVNDAPRAIAQRVVGAPGRPLLLTLQGEDVDGDALSFIVVESPANGLLTGEVPLLTYLPDPGFEGTDRLAFIVSDGQLVSAPAWVEIEVINRPPWAEDLIVETLMDTPVTLWLEAADPEDDPVTYWVVEPPGHGFLSGVPPVLRYTPAPGFTGEDRFVYRATDGALESASAVVIIQVFRPWDLPLRILHVEVEGDQVELAWAAEPGSRYRVVFKEQFDSAEWQVLAESLLATDAVMRWSGRIPTAGGTGFFQIWPVDE